MIPIGAYDLTLIISGEIFAEVRRAEKLHPNYPGMDDPVRSVGIVTEEVGEAMKEALDLTRGDRQVSGVDREAADMAYHKALYKETIQTAATAIRLLADMRRRKLVG